MSEQITCNCPAYAFPHRQGGGDCDMPGNCEQMNELGWEDACGECGMDDYCPIQDEIQQRIWENEQRYHPALTIQERNSDFRSW